MAKLSAHTAVIVEVPRGGGTAKEFDPLEPSDRLDAKFEWDGGDRVTLSVDQYRLDAHRTGSSDWSFFTGTEWGGVIRGKCRGRLRAAGSPQIPMAESARTADSATLVRQSDGGLRRRR